MLTIELPWPNKHMMPNALARRRHWGPRARARDEAHQAAFEATVCSAWDQGQSSETIDLQRADIPVEVIFCTPTRARADRDNLLAACKGYFDGIARAMGINDQKFAPTPRYGDVCRGGKVIVKIS